jgi:alpha-tubulin suppressor-like RCC1 family protein
VNPASTPTTGTSFSVGDYHACFIKADSTLWCWGGNSNGELGNGTTASSSTPVQVPGLTNVAQVSAGDFATCVLKTDGTVWCWGLNNKGQTGDGTLIERHTPVQVSGLTGVTSITHGSGHPCAIKNDNTVWCWGMGGEWGVFGALGNGTNNNSSVPVQVSGFNNALQIFPGYLHTCAVKTDGTVWCWGGNNSHYGGIHQTGQLGNNSAADSNVPVQVPGLTNVTQIYSGDFHSCALKNNGTVWCWGANDELGMQGMIGDGTAVAFRPSPVQVVGLTNVSKLGSGTGDFATCALKSDSTVWCWGSNISPWTSIGTGQLGDGTTISRNIPVQVTGFTGAVSVSTGEVSTCAGKNDGTVWCWGSNDSGQLGDGTTTNSLVPVQVQNLP